MRNTGLNSLLMMFSKDSMVSLNYMYKYLYPITRCVLIIQLILNSPFLYAQDVQNQKNNDTYKLETTGYATKERQFILDKIKRLRIEGDFNAALSLYNETIKDSSIINDDFKKVLLSRGAAIYHLKGEYGKSLKINQQILNMCKDNDYRCAGAMTNIGAAYYHLGNYNNGIKMLLRAKQLFAKLNRIKDSINVEHHIGFLLSKVGLYNESKTYLKKVLDYHKTTSKNEYLIRNALESYANLCVKTGAYNEAYNTYTESLELAKNPKSKLQSAIGILEVFIAKDSLDKAQEKKQDIEAVIKTTDNKKLLSKYYILASRLHFKKGDFASALTFNDKSYTINRDLQLPFDLIDNYTIYSEIYSAQQKWQASTTFLRKKDALEKNLYGPESYYTIINQVLDNHNKPIEIDTQNNGHMENKNLSWILIVLLALSIFVIVWIYLKHNSVNKEEGNEISENKTYQIILEEEKLFIDNKLKQLFEDEKIYLKSNLSLRVLSNEINCSEKKLSHYFNTVLETKFYTYLNTYRIKEAQKMLKSEQYKSLSIEGISMECGYRSRSAFYKAFKEITGKTPKQFKDSIV